jgi:hypothetical protein
MSAVQDRSLTIETLHHITSRLADSNLTAAEADVLRPMIFRLLGEVDRPARPGAGPEASPRVGR